MYLMKGLIKEFSPVTPLRDLSFLGEQTKLPLPLLAPFFSFPPYILTSLKYLLNANLFLIVVFHLLSHVRLFGTPWTAACQASLSSTVSQSLLKFMSIESVMLSNNLIICSPLLLFACNLSQLSSELALCIRWPKGCSFSFSISSSNEYS